MKIKDIPQEEIIESLTIGTLRYRMGPFAVRLQTDIRQVAELFHFLYGDYDVARGEAIADFHPRLERSKGPRRWLRPQAHFRIDGQYPFAPFPADTGFALLEWALNWCIATRAHQYLMLHAAVIEKEGRGLILPAQPGAGKSTLCAALSHRGWRLLSDEFGLVDPRSQLCYPLPRCIPLKNKSIEIIRHYCPDAVIGPIFAKTRKGDVAHLKPPLDSVQRANEPVPPALIVFPRYSAAEQESLQPLPKARAFIKLSSNAFNYDLLGAAGFRTVVSLVESSDCYLLCYNDLDRAVGILDDLLGGYREQAPHRASVADASCLNR